MKTHEILTHLEYATAEFESEAVCALLQIIEDIAANIESPLPEQYTAHLYAIDILAELREPEAHSPLLQLCLLSERQLNALFGNVIDGELDRALAATCGGDISGITLLIEDPEACEDVRIIGLRALVLLADSDQVSREDIVKTVGDLFERLEHPPMLLWDELVYCAHLLAPPELKPGVRSAWQDGRIEDDLDEIDRDDAESTPELSDDGWWDRCRAA